jgi:hypothetical protein
MMLPSNLGEVFGWMESPYGEGQTPDILPITHIDLTTGVITAIAFVRGERGIVKGLPSQFEELGYKFLKTKVKS